MIRKGPPLPIFIGIFLLGEGIIIWNVTRVGTVYGFSNGGRSFAGTVTRVSPMRKAKTHLIVTLELRERKHRRLTLGEGEDDRAATPSDRGGCAE